MKLHLRTRHRSLLPFLLALCLAVGAIVGVTLPASASGAPALQFFLPTVPTGLPTKVPTGLPGNPTSTPTTASNPTATVIGTLPIQENLALAEIATVRVTAQYLTGTGQLIAGATQNTTTCAGLGVLIQSTDPTGSAGQPYILTTNAIVADTLPCKANGPITAGTPLSQVTVYLSTAYTGVDNKRPGGIQFTIPAPSSVQTSGSIVFLPIPLTGNTWPHDYPTVRTASAQAANALIDLTDSTGKGLVQAVTGDALSDTVSPTGFLTPAFLSAPLGTLAGKVDPGAPLIDAKGQVVGLANPNGAPDILPVPELGTLGLKQHDTSCPSVSTTTQPCLSTLWQDSMDSYYGPKRDASTLKKITQNTRYSDFGGSQQFEAAATHGSQPGTTSLQPTSSTGISGLWKSLGTLGQIGLIVLGILVVLVLIMGILIYGRGRNRKRAQKRATVSGAFPQRKSGQVSSSPYAGPGAAAMAAPYAGEPPAAAVQRTIICPYCSAQNNAGSSNCYNCGRELPQGVGGVSGAGRGLARSTSGGGARLNLPSNPPQAPSPDIADFPTMVQQPIGAVPQNMENTLPNMPVATARSDESTVVMRGRKRPALGVKVSTKSDIGQRWRTRGGKGNEDNFLAVTGAWKHNGQVQPFGLFIIADGMGGHASGQDASKLAIETIYHHLGEQLPALEDVPDDQLTTLLQQAVQQANQMIYQQNQRDHADMGCTMTAALVTGNEAHVCNVGDSRTYILPEENHLQRITTDHSIVESLVAAGVIQRDDVYTHPKRNQIYRSLGEHENAEIDTFRQPLTPGDKLLLCCDGLWEMVRDSDIEHVMRMDDLPQVTNKLIDMANDAGGADNITAIVVKVTDEVKPPKAPMIESVASGPADISPPARR